MQYISVWHLALLFLRPPSISLQAEKVAAFLDARTVKATRKRDRNASSGPGPMGDALVTATNGPDGDPADLATPAILSVEGRLHPVQVGRSTLRFGSIAKVLAECKLKYHRTSECAFLQRNNAPVRFQLRVTHCSTQGIVQKAYRACFCCSARHTSVTIWERLSGT